MADSKLSDRRQSILIEDPLYTHYDLTDVSDEEFGRFVLSKGHVDAFCLTCEQMSVFVIEGLGYGFKDAVNKISTSGVIKIEAQCTRRGSGISDLFGDHCKMLVCFYRKSGSMVKIGQYPSRADLDLRSLDSVFSRELEKPLRAELGRAIGLRSHSVGVGSFVYLRRIFEKLVEEAHIAAQDQNVWDEAAYQNSRMPEKLKQLRRHLPSSLVNQRTCIRF